MILATLIAVLVMGSHARPLESAKVNQTPDTLADDTFLADFLLESALEEDFPKAFEVRQNYPNPFNATTTIEFDLHSESGVYAVIYNVLGSRIRTLENEVQAPGRHRLEWDGRNDSGDTVSSGVYFYVLVADDNYAIKKMLLLK